MEHLTYNGYVIEVLDEAAYMPGSADNLRTYQREYVLDDREYRPSSCHGVRVLDAYETSIHASCVLLTSGGATGIHDHSVFVNGDSLILAVGPFVVSLQLPSLALNWKVECDDITCFGVYHSAPCGCCVSHGELAVTRLSYDGKLVWSRGGRDILTNGFEVVGDRVEVVDFNDDVYAWDIRTGTAYLRVPTRRELDMAPPRGTTDRGGELRQRRLTSACSPTPIRGR